MPTLEVEMESRYEIGAKRLEAPAVSRMGVGRLTVGAVAFLALTGGAFWYQFHRIQATDGAPHWSGLRWGYFGLILLCLPVETVASALRTWLLARILQPGVSLWTCIKAEWANVAVAMLTPSQSGGGPGQIYLLHRGGARVGTALTISLLSFLGTMVGLFGMGLYSLLVSHVGATAPLFVAAAWTVTAVSAVILLGAIWADPLRIALAAASRGLWRIGGQRRPLEEWWPPEGPRGGAPVDRMGAFAAKLAGLLYTYRDDVRRFLRLGKATFAAVCILSFAFLTARALMPYLCLRFLGITGAGLGRVLELQVALIFLVFFAPTPGGAGLAEAASVSIMAEIVPVGFAPYYNLLWRFSTLYLAAIAGLSCLLHALAQDARRVFHDRP